MAKTSNLYIRIDPEVKADVERIYSQFGMSITDAVNIFLYASRNYGGLPFPLHSENPTIKDAPTNEVKSRGILHKYADPTKIPEEKGAWAAAVLEKYGNT
ncbi:MAG: type II toxin-antitoxin system RelB/DinJ family antitoxin [Ruminococcus sp.]|jgi:addiction module RelB/DinJ family antitoxin|nr:type II toxin-antitoxin system RelB/DinJ family antitoxin [Ruminococcus sp.]